MRDFLEQSGHLARYLIAWPTSTQGTRFYRDPPEAMPALVAYLNRLRQLLNLDLPLDDSGRLSPPVLKLEPEDQAWRRFHDYIEDNLALGSEMHPVRDGASKAADNAARLACLFHLLEHGPSGQIGAKHFKQAALVVGWHLYEAHRFFGELALPRELADAQRLDAWFGSGLGIEMASNH